MKTKKELRKIFSDIRNSVSDEDKYFFDNNIFTQFVNSSFINDYDKFLIYISVNNEVDTMNIIRYLLNNNKKIAVPFCLGKEMDFYYINSTDDLIEGRFGIPSVDINIAEKATDFGNALCIVPALAYDISGYRLGYGGGYYDRFLSLNKIDTLGLCFEKCITEVLPHETFDIKIDCVLTDSCLRNHKTKEVSTYG